MVKARLDAVRSLKLNVGWQGRRRRPRETVRAAGAVLLTVPETGWFKIQHRGQGTGTGKLGAIGTLVAIWTERYDLACPIALYSVRVSSNGESRGRDAILDPGPNCRGKRN